MNFTSKPEGVEQMTSTNKTAKKVFFRMMGLVIVFAIAAVPAFAGDGGPSQGEAKTTIAVDAVHALASFSLPGCGVADGESLRGCATTMRIANDKTQGNAVCQADRVYLNGSEQGGLCSLTGVNRAVGFAPVKVSTNGCSSITVWRPEGTSAPTVRMRDAEGYSWKLDQIVLRASQYQHTSAGDTWQLEPSSGIVTGLTPMGSWAVFTNGTRTLTMWLDGTLASMGSCEDGVDAASFKISLTATGFLQR